MHAEMTAWPAPPKLNLMLNIIGRREDGYHLLQTVFQFLREPCDRLSFELVSAQGVRLANCLPGVPEEQDLTVRAARLLQQESGCDQGVVIRVEKNLPMGGGLGGGSSDAATTLVALNHLWQTGFSIEQLMVMGLSLGADVPVFVGGASAWAEGVGEQCTPIEPPENWYVVIVPDCHVSTPAVFSHPGLTRDSEVSTIADFFSSPPKNDCLEAVLGLYPEVRSAYKDLSRFAAAHLTGTGACVFAAFEEEGLARQVARELLPRWRVILTKGVNRSPLLDCLQGLAV